MLCAVCVEVLSYNLVIAFMEVAHWKIVSISVCVWAGIYLQNLMCLLKPSAVEASEVWYSVLDAFEAVS